MSGTTRMHIDWTACDGRGGCTELLPEVLATDDWGYPVPRDGTPEPTIPDAIHGGMADGREDLDKDGHVDHLERDPNEKRDDTEIKSRSGAAGPFGAGTADHRAEHHRDIIDREEYAHPDRPCRRRQHTGR